MTQRLVARDGRLRVVVRAVNPMPRACGACTSCCSVMAVEELAKPAGTPCAHVRPGRGCSAYGSRPESCRGFQCLWLRGLHGTLPEHRPDRVGLVLVPTIEDRTIEAHETRPGAAATVDAMFLINALRESGLTVRIVPAPEPRTTAVTIGGRAVIPPIA